MNDLLSYFCQWIRDWVSHSFRDSYRIFEACEHVSLNRYLNRDPDPDSKLCKIWPTLSSAKQTHWSWCHHRHPGWRDWIMIEPGLVGIASWPGRSHSPYLSALHLLETSQMSSSPQQSEIMDTESKIASHLSQFFCPNWAAAISELRKFLWALPTIALVREEPVEERENFSIFFQDLRWKLLCNLDQSMCWCCIDVSDQGVCSPRRWLHVGVGPIQIARFVSELRPFLSGSARFAPKSLDQPHNGDTVCQ